MTTAKELYAKVTGDLDNATRERDSLKAQLADATSRISDAEAELRFIVWKLMPDALEALPHMFEDFSDALGRAKDARASSVTAMQEAQTRTTALKDEYEQAREDLGAYADGARAAMRASREYRSAEEGAASAEAVLQSNAPDLEEAERRLARFSELARQSLMHRILLSVDEKGESHGHFLLSLWHSIGRSLKDTEWFRRMDADRTTAARDVENGGKVRDKAIMDAEESTSAMQRLNLDFEASLQPRRKALKDKAAELQQTEKAAKGAKAAHLVADKRLSDLQEGRVQPAIAARATLASLLGKEFSTASKEDLAAIKALAERPGAAGLVKQAMAFSEEKRLATFDRISLTEQKDAIQSTIDELDKVKRKMSRNGLQRSSKTIDRAETFMMSDMSDGFDLETLTTIAIVADTVSDMGSSSNSDWSSGSSWGSSSFD
jgi:hypothetical protein